MIWIKKRTVVNSLRIAAMRKKNCALVVHGRQTQITTNSMKTWKTYFIFIHFCSIQGGNQGLGPKLVGRCFSNKLNTNSCREDESPRYSSQEDSLLFECKEEERY